MKIRRLFTFESSHIVRNCTSTRCSKSNHGHSNKVEVFLESDKLDNGQMIYDFGLMKNPIGVFLDAFDHGWHYWNQETDDVKKFIQKLNERWIEFPFSPTAENYALYFVKAINHLLSKTEMKNGEGNIVCSKVIYHETERGYAEAELKDVEQFASNYHLTDVTFSPVLMAELESFGVFPW